MVEAGPAHQDLWLGTSIQVLQALLLQAFKPALPRWVSVTSLSGYVACLNEALGCCFSCDPSFLWVSHWQLTWFPCLYSSVEAVGAKLGLCLVFEGTWSVIQC